MACSLSWICNQWLEVKSEGLEKLWVQCRYGVSKPNRVPHAQAWNGDSRLALYVGYFGLPHNMVALEQSDSVGGGPTPLTFCVPLVGQEGLH